MSGPQSMVVLGIDPGSHRTGWGLVAREGSVLCHVDSGTIVAGDGNLAARLCRIADDLDVVLARRRPTAVAIETVFHAKNAQSALLLGHARGVALLCAARLQVPVFEYTAGQIKRATTGHGRADKQQVQSMVRMILDKRDAMSLDTSDALAAAICHAQTDSTPTARALRAEADAARRSARRRRP